MENCNPMEVLYQRRCSKFVYVVPVGLRELMSDISREVLRCNPKYLNSFIADYLEALLITRENARVACRIVDQLAESSIIVAQMLKKLRINKDQAEQAAKVIQKAFRKYKNKGSMIQETFDEERLIEKLLHRSNISLDQAYQAALIIQRAYRCYRAKMETEDPCAQINWRLAAKRTIGIFRDLNVPRWELVRAATLIKAAYKGYYTRKLLKDLTKQAVDRTTSACRSIDLSDLPSKYSEYPTEAREIQVIDYDEIMHQIQEHAAIVIQRAFRVYSLKKKLMMQAANRESYLVNDLFSQLTDGTSEEDAMQFPFQDTPYDQIDDYPY